MLQSLPMMLLRISIGYLMVIWGVDKLVDLEHAKAVSDAYYSGLLSAPDVLALMTFIGALEVALGLLIMLGLLRKFLYPILVLLTLGTLIAVLPSVIDPWGWYLKKTNVLFYPSIIVFSGALVLTAFRRQDSLALDRIIGLN